METENWRDVFQDSALNERLCKDGIVKFKLPQFDASIYTEILKEEVKGYPHDFESGFYGSVSISDEDVKRKVDRLIAEKLSGSIEKMLKNHRLLTYFFLVKGIGEKSVLNLHQDWSIVDEREYRSYNLWIPLCNSTKENGTLYVAKGTHRLPLNVRGPGIPPKFNEHFSIALKYLKPIEVKVGEALLFDARILHFSPPNATPKSRTTIITNVIPESVETICFHGKEINGSLVVDCYEVPDDLFIHYTNFNEQKESPNPKGIYKERIHYGNTERVEATEFEGLLELSREKNKKWFSFFG